MDFDTIKTLSTQYDHKRPILTKLRAISLCDESPDLSYLETDEDDEHHEEDAQRLASYGDSWECVGIRVQATIVIPRAEGNFQREHTLQSGGLWGIESDSGDAYFREVAQDEWNELKSELAVMNVVIPDGVEIEYEF